VHTFHGHVFSGYFGRLGNVAVRAVERVLAAAADAVIVISTRQRADIVERFRIAPAHKVHVVPLGLRIEPLLTLAPGAPSLRPELGIPADAIVFGFVGRFAPIKDLSTLVEAFVQLAAAEPHAHLLLIGDGETRADVEAQAARSGAASRIHFMGWRTDLPCIFATIDIGVLTSRNEGTPVALIETLAAGKPVVATNVGGVADVVDDGETGLLVEPGDAPACAAAMRRLADDPALRQAMGATGRTRMAKFGHARLADDIARLYTQLIAARCP
jgi:glycosyltransferase involved in cell wall biosynthesis